jgi:Protein involved in formate dehydrogenase formation
MGPAEFPVSVAQGDRGSGRRRRAGAAASARPGIDGQRRAGRIPSTILPVTPERRRPSRPEPREIVELRHLKIVQPELGPAADMHIALIELQRRVQARVSLPWIATDAAWLARQQAAGQPLIRFEEIPIDWTELRLMLRQTADILRRFESLDEADHDQIQALARDGRAIEPLVEQWYRDTAARRPADPIPGIPMLGPVLVLAIRPFLARCAEALMPTVNLAPWKRGYCPMCGWDPDFSVIASTGERLLICGRCTASWKFDPIACPFCDNADRSRITSFATRDGRYRLAGCDRCHRYMKAYDARNAPRPVLPPVDTVATLPLDAEAVRRGYEG